MHTNRSWITTNLMITSGSAIIVETTGATYSVSAILVYRHTRTLTYDLDFSSIYITAKQKVSRFPEIYDSFQVIVRTDEHTHKHTHTFTK